MSRIRVFAGGSAAEAESPFEAGWRHRGLSPTTRAGSGISDDGTTKVIK